MAKEKKQNEAELQLKKLNELIEKHWYFNKVYTYLLKFENEFTNLTEFILNCEYASNKVFHALLKDNENKQPVKTVIDNNGFYDFESKLPPFELYITKFIVAHCLVSYFKEDTIRTTYFNQINSITERQKNEFKYFIHYKRGGLCADWTGWGVCYDWLLKINTEKYVVIEKNKLSETMNKLKQQSTPPQDKAKQIEPIWWQGSGRLLGYLMEQLSQAGFIDKQSNFNKLIKEHFIDKDKKPFTDSIAQNRSGAGSNKGTSKNKGSKPKGHNEIDTLIENLKQHPE